MHCQTTSPGALGWLPMAPWMGCQRAHNQRGWHHPWQAWYGMGWLQCSGCQHLGAKRGVDEMEGGGAQCRPDVQWTCAVPASCCSWCRLQPYRDAPMPGVGCCVCVCVCLWLGKQQNTLLPLTYTSKGLVVAAGRKLCWVHGLEQLGLQVA